LRTAWACVIAASLLSGHFFIDDCENQGGALVTVREGRILIKNGARQRKNGPSGSRPVSQNQGVSKRHQ
jgi:hypothetical protein